MAVFTTFSEEALARYVVMFGLGELASHQPIDGGIENSNYFLTLSKDGEDNEYVLTIIEELTFDDLPFFNKVLMQLFHHGLPVAAPRQTLDGMTSTIFCGKPALLFKRLPGEHPVRVTDKHCFELGKFMATSHLALSSLTETRDNPYSVEWMRNSVGDLELDTDISVFLNTHVHEYETLHKLDLPTGLIHGDLFIDNALFEKEQLTGVIDFYHACRDVLIQDLAIAINDWCSDNGTINTELETAMLKGYESERELSQEERKALRPMQRASAARFALTRYQSGNPPMKDPAEMLKLAEHLS